MNHVFLDLLQKKCDSANMASSVQDCSIGVKCILNSVLGINFFCRRLSSFSAESSGIMTAKQNANANVLVKRPKSLAKARFTSSCS